MIFNKWSFLSTAVDTLWRHSVSRCCSHRSVWLRRRSSSWWNVMEMKLCACNIFAGCTNVVRGVAARKALVRIAWSSTVSAFVCRCFEPATRDGACVAVTISTRAPSSVLTQVTVLSLYGHTRLGDMFVCCHVWLLTNVFPCRVPGVVLRLGRNLEEPFLSKSQKEEQLSDDEVEVVEEWTLPSGQKKPVTETLETSPPLYVPVIQRSADQPSALLDGQREQPEHSVSYQVSCFS